MLKYREPIQSHSEVDKVVKKAKQGEPAPSTSNCPANCAAKKSDVTVLKPDIPQGLIGLSSNAPVKINGQQCDALLDSGSQVTIIFEQ